MKMLLATATILTIAACAPAVSTDATTNCDVVACPDAPGWTFTSHGGQADAISLAVDGSGNVYSVGFFEREANLGEGRVPKESGGFVSKLDPNGHVAWVETFDSPVTIGGVGVDPTTGDVVVGGSISEPITIQGQPFAPPPGVSAAFVAAFDAGGALVWARVLETTGEYVEVAALAVSADGAIGLGGMIATSASLDAYVASLGPDGATRFERSTSTPDEGWIESMTLSVGFDVNGALWAGGWAEGDVWFDHVQASAGDSAAFLVKLAPSGAVDWLHALPGTSHVEFDQIRATPSGDMALGGWYAGSPDLGVGPLVASVTSQPFVAVMSVTGDTLAARGFACTSSAELAGLDVDSAGDVVMAGYFNGTLDIAGGLTSAHDTVFVAALDDTLAPRWVRSFAGSSDAYPEAVVLDPVGRVLVSGEFSGTMDLGAGERTNATMAPAMFVAKLPR